MPHSRPPSQIFNLLIFLLVVLLLDTGVLSCFPGRPTHRSRPRKRSPFVFKEHVPNTPELSPVASGSVEGRIKRGSPKFRRLLANYNPDVVFKDEERTGEDRIMSKRCREKIDHLALLVLNQWPDVKLRVTEAYDDKFFHAKDSLHYEGRAVDITTSDRDRRKYGMLASLAVIAGFDYVYYESRHHVHASVKSDTARGVRHRGCFPSSTEVLSKDRGPIRVDQVLTGEEILSIHNGEPEFSPVIMFLDHQTDVSQMFLKVSTENRRNLTITPYHLIRRFDSRNCEILPDSLSSEACSEAIFARELRIGDLLLTVNSSGSTELSGVTYIGTESDNGLIAPLTKSGSFVANGISVSAYAAIADEGVAHMAFAPIRWLDSIRYWRKPRVRSLPNTSSNYVKLLEFLAVKLFRFTFS